jgi:hypothetical protein
MRTRRPTSVLRTTALAAAPVCVAMAAFGACGTAPVDVALTMSSPLGLLDDATRVELSVFDAKGSSCGDDGHVDVPGSAQQFDLDDAGCPAGIKWCGEITLDRDGSNKMFSVVASGPNGVLGEGCATATIDQDPVEVSITIVRYNPPACCNDGVLQAGEQCEGTAAATDCAGGPGGECTAIVPDAVCECNCTSKEVPVDRSDPTVFPAAQTQQDLALVFAPGSSLVEDALRAVYVDRTASGGGDLRMRFLQKDLSPTLEPLSFQQPLALPVDCAGTGTSLARLQEQPAIATTGSDTVIAYVSNLPDPSKFNIFVQHQNQSGCTPKVETDGGQVVSEAAGDSAEPDVAGGPTGTALVVWTQGGSIRGRTWSPPPTSGASPVLGAEMSIASGAHPRVAGTSSGWKVTYQGNGAGDADGVFVRAIDAALTVGAEQKVNAATSGVQDQPAIAAFPDGRFAVAWRSGGDVFFQRFLADGSAVAGDQDEPLNTTTDGEQAEPAIAASVGFGDFYAVAWEATSAGEVWARLAGASEGYEFNSVTGQNDDFLASLPGVTGARRRPAVAIGGGGFVAVGWHDDSTEHAGVYVRRFPLP